MKINLTAILEDYSQFIRSNSVVKEFKEGFYFSFPFLYTGGHYIELFIKQLGENIFYVSDLGNVLMELRASGLEVLGKKRRKEILLDILKKFHIDLDGLTLQKNTSRDNLIPTIHRFIEATKAISDLIYFHEVKVFEKSYMYQEIRHILEHKEVQYSEGYEARIEGKLEKHTVDFLVQNGRPNAIVTLAGDNTKQLAEIWGFKFSDIKELNAEVQSISVYDVEDSKWSETSKRILNAKSDYFIPSDEIERLERLI